MRSTFALIALAAAAVMPATSALAVNKIVNGSFEQAATTGAGAFTGWQKANTPTGAAGRGDTPASVIRYNSNAQYPISAFGERVTPDNLMSGSPDAVGSYAAYFVGDRSVNETIFQDVYLAPGNFRVGFSYYLPQNGLNNSNNSSISVKILGMNVADTMITGSSVGRTWFYASGVAAITTGGWYRTSLVYNSNGFPAKDIVVDRVFGVRTTDPATVVIGPGVVGVPEPSAWMMLITGFGMVGFGMRRRRTAVAA